MSLERDMKEMSLDDMAKQATSLEDIEEDDDGPDHPLECGFTFWFNKRVQGQRVQEQYERTVQKIGSFDTVEQFWSYYNFLVRPDNLPLSCDYHVFRDGVKPMWEDAANVNGGKFIIRLPKNQASKLWEDLVLAFIGGQLSFKNEICGIVVSIRYSQDIISIWNTSKDVDLNAKISSRLKEILPGVQEKTIEYKPHSESIKDNTSFRNTSLDHLTLPTKSQGVLVSPAVAQD